MAKICYGCFREYSETQKQCPYCGYNNESDRERFPLALPNGTLLGGHYRIGWVLGQGGFGITYLAQESRASSLVAIKEYFPDSMAIRENTVTVHVTSEGKRSTFELGKKLFLQEAHTLADLKGNKHVVEIYEYFEENKTAYFSMEYIPGVDFKAYIQERGGRISFDEAMKIVRPVLDALSAVHSKGIVHRDVTPDNIRISENGEVKLLDFGAARYSVGNVTKSLDVILKHGYAPLEQYSRHGKQGAFTDVYSISATLYYAITGKKPSDSVDRREEDLLALPSALGADIGHEQEEALIKGLAVQAQDRFQTAKELRDALMNAPNLWKEEAYQQAQEKIGAGEIVAYEEAINLLTDISDYKDAIELIEQCRDTIRKEKIYYQALEKARTGKIAAYEEAIRLLADIPDYKDAVKQIEQYRNKIKRLKKMRVLYGVLITGITIGIVTTAVLLLKREPDPEPHSHISGESIIENRVESTCTESGSYDIVTYCEICREELSRNHVTIQATGHKWGDWTVVEPATLETEGTRTRICKNDPTHIQSEKIPALELLDRNEIENAMDILKGLLPDIEQGNAEAMRKVGDYYMKGAGVETNYQEALYWYLRAIEAGNKEAMYRVAFCFENGLAIEKNDQMADYWRERSTLG